MTIVAIICGALLTGVVIMAVWVDYEIKNEFKKFKK